MSAEAGTIAGGRAQRRATLYRMATDTHTCPFGLKARDLLRRKGYDVDDKLIRSRTEQEAFKSRHEVKTTPQVFIGGTRIGGYEALRRHLGMPVASDKEKTYAPVIAIFAMAAVMAGAFSWAAFGGFGAHTLRWFLATSMCLLALQKLRDVESFTNGFLGYDLLAQRWVPYAYVYPYAEALAGVLMLAGALTWLAAPVAILIGGIGAVSVVKAVYIDGRDIRCACVGGDSKVPLGAVSLTENLMMLAAGIWMLLS